MTAHSTTALPLRQSFSVYVMNPVPDQFPDLFGCFRQGTPDKPFVVAQLGQSLDGRVATLTGDSKYINRAAALDHLHRIRAHVDAVVIGIGTAIADDPLLTVRRVNGPSPARVVIDPKGRLPLTAKCLKDDGVPRYVVRLSDHPVPAGVETIVLEGRGEHLRPRTIVEALGRRGMRRILVEGGARTISAFIDDRAIDRLHVMVAPLLLGSGKPALDLRPIGALSEALRPSARTYVLSDGDVLFDCDMRHLVHEGAAA
jgi:diaminohydroxyphosphoribosylaminopyrimidine deaminase/5-amino-6-(5-phosphoribosylamino)uracil reductase